MDIVSTGSVFWKLGTESIDIRNLPSQAFDSPTQQAETAALLAEHNEHHSMAPDLDAKFAALAADRLWAHPLLCRVEVPALRVADMILRPRTETFALNATWWEFGATRWKSAATILSGLLNVGLVIADVSGVVRRRCHGLYWGQCTTTYAASC